MHTRTNIEVDSYKDIWIFIGFQALFKTLINVRLIYFSFDLNSDEKPMRFLCLYVGLSARWWSCEHVLWMIVMILMLIISRLIINNRMRKKWDIHWKIIRQNARASSTKKKKEEKKTMTKEKKKQSSIDVQRSFAFTEHFQGIRKFSNGLEKCFIYFLDTKLSNILRMKIFFQPEPIKRFEKGKEMLFSFEQRLWVTGRIRLVSLHFSTDHPSNLIQLTRCINPIKKTSLSIFIRSTQKSTQISMTELVKINDKMNNFSGKKITKPKQQFN